MVRLFWWCFGIIFLVTAVAGVVTSSTLWNHLTDTGGSTTGVMAKGIPTFAGGFQKGWNAGAGAGNNRGNGAGMTSWFGPTNTNNWTGPQQQRVQIQRPRRVAPAAQH